MRLLLRPPLPPTYFLLLILLVILITFRKHLRLDNGDKATSQLWDHVIIAVCHYSVISEITNGLLMTLQEHRILEVIFVWELLIKYT